MTHVDGNALAGMLADALGIDATVMRLECAHCGSASAVAEVMVTFDGPDAGAVAHCPDCSAVLLTLRERDGELRIDVRGIRSLAVPGDQAR